MSVGIYLLAGGIGFAFGALVAFGNAQITQRAVEKDSTNAVMAGSMLRMLVNIAALAVVYFTRNLLPLPFYGTIIGTAAGLSLVGIRLYTGRTHQIRVQFASRGLPLVGDRKYGPAGEKGPIALFSCRVGFTHPESGERLSFFRRPPESGVWTLFDDGCYAPFTWAH